MYLMPLSKSHEQGRNLKTDPLQYMKSSCYFPCSVFSVYWCCRVLTTTSQTEGWIGRRREERSTSHSTQTTWQMTVFQQLDTRNKTFPKPEKEFPLWGIKHETGHTCHWSDGSEPEGKYQSVTRFPVSGLPVTHGVSDTAHREWNIWQDVIYKKHCVKALRQFHHSWCEITRR